MTERAKRARTSDEDRARLIDMVFNHNFPVRRACEIVKMKVRTAYGVVRVFQRENRSEAKKSSGRPKKFDRRFEKSIEGFVRAQPDATLKELQRRSKCTLDCDRH